MFHKLRHFLPLFILITGICGVIALTVQQNYRLSANDPQIQMAEDTGIALSGGQKITDLLSTQKIDIATSIAPFLVIYDNKGLPIAASGTLNNQLPQLPAGIFNYVDQNGEDKVTWQPFPGVRDAIVVVKYVTDQGTGYVMAGRSLREIEKRETQLETQVAIGWGVTILATLITALFILPRQRK